MKKHVALTLLLITTLGVLNAHVDVPSVDGRRFVQTQGQMYDAIGWSEDLWTRSTRNCSQVRALGRTEPMYAQALEVIQAFSPPDSRSARLRQLQQNGDWLLAEVEFDELSPAVVVLQLQGKVVELLPTAIWSGDTQPWRPAPLIRRHLHTQAPLVPQPLLDCLDPQVGLFQPR
jgi:hypothetical protein